MFTATFPLLLIVIVSSGWVISRPVVRFLGV